MVLSTMNAEPSADPGAGTIALSLFNTLPGLSAMHCRVVEFMHVIP